MLTRDVLFEGFTTEHWARLLSLFDRHGAAVSPPSNGRGEGNGAPEAQADEPGDGPAAQAPVGGVIALYEKRPDGRSSLRKLLHTHHGRLDPRAQPWPVPPADLAARHRAAWAVELAMGALEELAERFGQRVQREHDMVAQIGLLLRIARELSREGLVRTYPRDMGSIPIVSEAAVGRALDAVCPDGGVAAIAVFDAGELWTAIAVQRRGNGFARILGPNALRPRLGLLSGDFRRDHRHVVSAVRDMLGPLAFGCFTELRTLRALEQQPLPGAWAYAVLIRDIIIDPMPLPLTIPLLVDAARATWAALRGLVGRWDVRRGLTSAIDRIGARRSVHDR